MDRQLFTLRSHKLAVSCISSFSIRSKTYIVSGDKDGVLTLWDIAIRRSLIVWKGHSESVLSILTFGDYLITHARDSSIKYWKFESVSAEPNEVLDIPVNSLNFCNIDGFNNYIFTAATTSSNNFDCYFIDPIDFSIKRVITNFNCYTLVNGQSTKDYGIIMKMNYISTDSILIVAFESGDFVVVKIDWNSNVDLTKKGDRLILNKDPIITLLIHNSTHSPNPITAISYSEDLVYIGSTTRKIVKQSKNSPPELIKTKHLGVLLMIPFKTSLLVAYWNGLIEIIEGNPIKDPSNSDDHDDKSKSTLTKVSKTVSTIDNSAAIKPVFISRSTPSETNLETPKANMKLSSLFLLKPQQNLNTYNKGHYKSLLRAKKHISSPILFAGYEDGIIAAYNIPEI